MAAVEIPATGSAPVHVLHDECAGLDVNGDRVITPGHSTSIRPGNPA